MTTETLNLPTFDEAARADRDAYATAAKLHANHQRLRHRHDIIGTNRARTQMGAAFGDLIGARVALAEAMDRRSPAWAASVCENKVLFKRADTGHEACDRAWDAYQQARRSGAWPAINAARSAWRDALIDWQLARYAELGQEDEHLAEDLSGRVDTSMLLDPESEIFPPPQTRAQRLASESKERARQQELNRDRTRYDRGSLGWQPAGGRRA